ncbi:MAG: porin [Alphaproteobacteria bacterium]
MKKVLLGTTALMAAGIIAGTAAQAASPIKLNVGGYMTERVGISANDYHTTDTRDGTEGADIKNDGEIIFSGKTKLDNGITVGVNVQLEARQGGGGSSVSDTITPANQIDETYMFVSGNFGRVNIGSENTAAYLMHYRHGAASGSLSLDEGTITRWIPQPTGHAYTINSAPLVSNDRQSITYFTPRVEGVQGGISYVPSASRTQGTNLTPDRKATVSTGGSANGLYDGISLAVNFDRKFDQARVKVSASWERYQGTDSAAPSQDDLEQRTIGAILSFGGFSIGGSWKKVEDDVDSTGTASGDQTVFAAGAGYRMGPTYFTVNYIRGEAKIVGVGDDETRAWMAAASHNIGPGISVHAAVMRADYDGAVAGNTDDANGWSGVVGATARF